MSLLWDRTRTLPKEEFAKVKGVYQDNTLPLEVRLHLAAWIEEKFLPGNAFDMTDADFGQMAAAVSQEMVHQLDLQVDAIPNDPDKFLTKHRLQEISDNLKVAILRFISYEVFVLDDVSWAASVRRWPAIRIRCPSTSTSCTASTRR